MHPHDRWQQHFLEYLGLEDEDVQIVMDVMSMKQFMVWRGRNDVVFRHTFEHKAQDCTMDEINAIKVKVKLSRC